MSKVSKREPFEQIYLKNKQTQNKRELPKVSSQANNQKNKTMVFTQHSLEYSQINSISATELGKGAQRLMPLQQLSQPMAISSISQKDPQQPKNFYHHSTIYRINEYKDLSQNQLYVSSGTRINSLQDKERLKKALIADFKRNVAEYLMTINYNKDLALKTFRKFYADKTHHQISQDFPTILNNTVNSSKLIMDYSNCHIPRQISNNTFNYKLLEVDVLVLDREGRSQKRRVDHKQLQQSLIRRMEPFLNSEKIDYDAKMYLLMRQYEEIVDRIYDESFLVRLSGNMHPNSNPNFNDFYEYGDANLPQPRSNYSFHDQLIQCSVSPLPSDFQFETIHQSIVLEEDLQEGQEQEYHEDEDDDEDTQRKKRQVQNKVKKIVHNDDDNLMQKKIFEQTVSYVIEDPTEVVDRKARDLKRAQDRLERRMDIERVQRELQQNNNNISEEFKYNTDRTEEEEVRYDQRSSKKNKKKLENPSSSISPDKIIQKQNSKQVINPILDNIQPLISDHQEVQSLTKQRTGGTKPMVKQQQKKQKTEGQIEQDIQIGQPDYKHSLTSNDDQNPVKLNLNLIQPSVQLKDKQQVKQDKQDQQGQKQNKDYNGPQQSKNQKTIITQQQDNNQEIKTKSLPTVQQMEIIKINDSNNLDIQKDNQNQYGVQSSPNKKDNKDQTKQSPNQKERVQLIKSPSSTPKKNNDIQSPERKGGKVGKGAFFSQKISTFGENASNKITENNEMNIFQQEDSLLNEKGYQEELNQSQTDEDGNNVFFPNKYISEQQLKIQRNFIDVMLECVNCYDEEIVEWKISQFDMNLLVMPNLENNEDRAIYKDLYAWKEELPYVIPRLRMLNMLANPDPNEEQLELEEERKEKEKKTQKDEKKKEKDMKKDKEKQNNINKKIN